MCVCVYIHVYIYIYVYMYIHNTTNNSNDHTAVAGMRGSPPARAKRGCGKRRSDGESRAAGSGGRWWGRVVPGLVIV